MNDACASDSIASWLETVIKEQCHALPDLHAAKRKREHSPDQLTPESPPSMSAKRRRREVEDDDVFATPRALGRAPADTSSTSSISHGNSTGAKTPIKQFQRMEVASRDPVRVRQLSFNDPELPDPLRTLAQDLSLLSKSRGIIHQGLQSLLLDAQRTDLRLSDLDDVAFASPSFFTRLAHPNLHPYLPSTSSSSSSSSSSAGPSLNEVLDIHAAAKECQNEMHPEASWNMLVHQRILALAVPHCWEEDGGPVHFLPCTTAKIHPVFRRGLGPGSAANKMVDFAIYIEPSTFGPGTVTAIDTLRRHLPDASINHTDFAPLRRRPIALSIESKTTGHQLLEAEVQVGVWLAAQWRMLEGLGPFSQEHNTAVTTAAVEAVAEAAAAAAAASAATAAATITTAAVAGDDSMSPLPPFLPAIIIQGHEWHFLATTRDSKGITTLWAKQTFGSSETVLGIYQVVCVLRYLAQWVGQEYWPCVRGLARLDQSMSP